MTVPLDPDVRTTSVVLGANPNVKVLALSAAG